MRGWQRPRPGRDGFDVAPEHLAVGSRAGSLGSRREHAIDATTAAATALGSRGDRAAAATPNGSTWDEKLSMARRRPPRRSGRKLRSGGRAEAGATRSPQAHRPRARRPRPRSSDYRRAGSAPGRAGTPTSWGRSVAAPARAPSCATRSRSSSPRRRSPTSATHPRCAYAPARVLSRQPSDQVARLGRKRRTAGSAPAAASASLKHCPVPAAERSRADRKAGPPLGREQLAHRSEQGPVDGRVPRPLPTAPEIASWWRSTTISSSRSPPPRASTPRRQHRSRYSKHVSTTRSLNMPGRDHQHAHPSRNRISLPPQASREAAPDSRSRRPRESLARTKNSFHK